MGSPKQRGEDSRRGRNPRVAHQATREFSTDEVEAPSPTGVQQIEAGRTDQQDLAPRTATQSTQEFDVESARPPTDPGQVETPAAVTPRQVGRAGHPVTPPISTPTLTDMGDGLTAVAHGGDEDWPPVVADYQGGDAGETVQEARGISARDLAGIDLDTAPPAGPETDQSARNELPDPWAAPAPGAPPPAPLQPAPRLSVDTGAATPAPVVVEPPDTAGRADPEPTDAPDSPTGESVVSSAEATAVGNRVALEPQADRHHSAPASSSTDHVRVQQSKSSVKVILLAASAVLLLLGLAVGGILTLTDIRLPGAGGAPASGSLLIRTSPAAGCTVFVDSKPTGLIAPGDSLLIGDLPARQYKVSIRCIEFAPFDKTVALKTGEVLVLKAALKRD